MPRQGRPNLADAPQRDLKQNAIVRARIASNAAVTDQKVSRPELRSPRR